MHLRVHPRRFGIVVMKDQNDINPVLTNKLRERRYLEVQEALTAFTFRPILQTQMELRRNVDIAGLRMVVRFDYTKDGLNVWQQIQPQMFETEAIFYPDIVLNLTPYKTERRIVGLWEISAHMTIIAGEKLAAVLNDEKVQFLTRLSYEPVGSFEWEVVRRIDTRLTPTGELADPRAQPRNLRDVTVSVNDI